MMIPHNNRHETPIVRESVGLKDWTNALPAIKSYTYLPHPVYKITIQRNEINRFTAEGSHDGFRLLKREIT